MPKNGTIAYIRILPPCNFPHPMVEGQEIVKAEYDFKTKVGPWAYGCEEHYIDNRFYDELGIGKGQKLEARPDAISEVKTV